jgi:hypothetical protein
MEQDKPEVLAAIIALLGVVVIVGGVVVVMAVLR